MTTQTDQQPVDQAAEAKVSPWAPDGRRIFWRFLSYLGPYRWWLALGGVTLVTNVGLGLVLPKVVQSLVDTVLIAKDTVWLAQISLGLLAIFLVQSVLNFIHQLALMYVGERVVANIRNEVYRHLQSLSLSFYNNHRTGEIVSRLTNDVALIQQTISGGLLQGLAQIASLVAIGVLLFVLDWWLTLIIFVLIPIVLVIMFVLGFQIEKVSKLVQEQLGHAANILEETTSGVRIVQSFAREAHEIGRFSRAVELTFQTAMRRSRATALMGSAISFLGFGAFALALWFGSFEVINQRISPGGLVSYLIYTILAASSMALIAAIYGQVQSALGASRRIFDLLDIQPEIADRPGAKALPVIKGEVSFQQASFHYDTTTPVLHDIEFAAKPGQMIALVGPSGSGKTTLVNLIPRFYDVHEGRILIDGIDIRDVTLQSLRGQIGIVPQDPLLFASSIADNIRYGRLDATQEEVEEAARAANAHHFIVNELTDGYETLVGERGVKLSGGQRQRIAIARAILKDPRILILDEATSALDSESEQLIQEAIERLMVGRTSFVIAHRLSTITKADWIIVLSRGRVVEQGTHGDLLARPDGIYQRLYTLQYALGEIEPNKEQGVFL